MKWTVNLQMQNDHNIEASYARDKIESKRS